MTKDFFQNILALVTSIGLGALILLTGIVVYEVIKVLVDISLR